MYIKCIVMLCAIWCPLFNFKNVENTLGGQLVFKKLQASTPVRSIYVLCLGGCIKKSIIQIQTKPG